MNPLVSIVIPCYNSAAWVGQAIESCVGQGWRPLEIVVVDDGSSDASLNVASSQARRFPEMVRVHSQTNQGAPAARNTGAALAGGEFLLFLDADDYLLDSAIEHLAGSLLDGAADIAYGDAMFVDSTGRALGRKKQSPHSRDSVITMLENSPITSSTLFRRTVIASCPWDTSLACNQDNDLNVRCAISGHSYRFVPVPVAAIRQHSSPTRISNTTHRHPVSAETRAGMLLRYRSDLFNRQSVTAQRLAALDYMILREAFSLWRSGKRQNPQQLLRIIDKRAARASTQFKRLSYHNIALLAGLRASDFVFRLYQWLKKGVALGEARRSGCAKSASH